MNSFLPRQGFLKFSCHSTPNYLESPICSKPKRAVCDTWEKWSFSESCFIGIVPRWSDFSQTWNRWHYPNTGNLRKRLKASDNLDDFYCWWSESTQDDHHQDDQWWSTQDDQDDHQWPHQDRLRQDYGREGFYAFTDAIDFTQYKVTHTLEQIPLTRITCKHKTSSNVELQQIGFQFSCCGIVSPLDYRNTRTTRYLDSV